MLLACSSSLSEALQIGYLLAGSDKAKRDAQLLRDAKSSREPEPPPGWEDPPPPEAEWSLETEAWAAAAWVLAT